MKANEDLTQELAESASLIVLKELNAKKFNLNSLQKSLSKHLEDAIQSLTSRKPIVIPVVVDIDALA